MTKAVLERGLAEELTEHLGYDPHERRELAGTRDGTTFFKRLANEAGPVDLEVPPDRTGLFEPRLVRRASAA